MRFLEEARVGWLAHHGTPYHALVRDELTELVVAELNIRYRTPGLMGECVRISVVPENTRGVRISLTSEMKRTSDNALLATASVTLAPVNTETGKLRRKLPHAITQLLKSNTTPASTSK